MAVILDNLGCSVCTVDMWLSRNSRPCNSVKLVTMTGIIGGHPRKAVDMLLVRQYHHLFSIYIRDVVICYEQKTCAGSVPTQVFSVSGFALFYLAAAGTLICFWLKVSSSPAASTVITSPSLILPCSISSDSWSSTIRWITRRSGRAPYIGS